MSGPKGDTGTQSLAQTLAIGNNAGTYSIGINSYTTNVSVSNITGTTAVSLSSTNTYAYTLTGNTTFGYVSATTSVYNFLIKAGTYSFSLDSAYAWQTVGATALGFTGSFVMSGIYDGTDMWISTIKNYLSY
jgi:LDH2 family malate/lactate/ureidoglycolate dehydrogenase